MAIREKIRLDHGSELLVATCLIKAAGTTEAKLEAEIDAAVAEVRAGRRRE